LQGDNVPPPITSFEAGGFPSEILKEVWNTLVKPLTHDLTLTLTESHAKDQDAPMCQAMDRGCVFQLLLVSLYLLDCAKSGLPMRPTAYLHLCGRCDICSEVELMSYAASRALWPIVRRAEGRSR